MSDQPKIFISYSWNDRNIVDEIDNDLKIIGINLIRDVRELSYKDSIKEFMSRIRENDYAILLISDDYLKSFNCMYEVLELLKEKDYKDKLLPILKDKTKIFTPTDRLSYIGFWQSKSEEISNKASILKLENLNSITKDIAHYKNIASEMGLFLSTIADMLIISYSDLKRNNYKEIIEHIGYNRNDLINELIKINHIENYDEKLVKIEQFILQNPNIYNGYYFKAFIHKNKEIAILNCNKVIELIPNSSDAYSLRGKIHYENKCLSDAMKDSIKALEIDPTNISAVGGIGSIYYDQGKYTNAEIQFSKAIEIDPSCILFYINKGNVLKALYKYEEALEYYNKAIVLNNDNLVYTEGNTTLVEMLSKKAKVLIDLEKYNQAIEQYNKIIEIEPSDSNKYNERGRIFYSIARYDNALNDFNKAIEIDNNALSYMDRGTTYMLMSRFKESEHNYNQAIELMPEFANAYLARAVFYEVIGDVNKAIKDYNKGIEINPTEEKGYLYRGILLKNIGEFDNAIEDLTNFIDLKPKIANGYIERAIVYDLQNKKDKADEDRQKASKYHKLNI
ncbi:tetratricopeptide repeat protein [Bacteroidota bacterium]